MTDRLRRMRKSPIARDLICETVLNKHDFISPIFVVEGNGLKQEIPSMPGVFRYSVDMLEEEVTQVCDTGVTAVLIFGIPTFNHKDWCASAAYDPNGVVQQAILRIRQLAPELYIITDTCMCEYTDHGHCGILDADGIVDNDKTLEYISKIALSYAEAGADMVAPSDMMDGHVRAIRKLLDKHGHNKTPIMAYSAKYASNFYGPFRDAAESAPTFGDRRSYQMDYRNTDEALREVALDLQEGADIIMVKPAIFGLDILRRVKDEFNAPLAAYVVSGEYSMLKNAIDNGLLNPDAMFEAHIAVKRAGAKLLISYAAKDICREL